MKTRDDRLPGILALFMHRTISCRTSILVVSKRNCTTSHLSSGHLWVKSR